jgi:uncharacterized membrane protein
MIGLLIGLLVIILCIIVFGWIFGLGLGILGNKTQLSADIAAARKRDEIDARGGVHLDGCDCLGCTGVGRRG